MEKSATVEDEQASEFPLQTLKPRLDDILTFKTKIHLNLFHREESTITEL